MLNIIIVPYTDFTEMHLKFNLLSFTFSLKCFTASQNFLILHLMLVYTLKIVIVPHIDFNRATSKVLMQFNLMFSENLPNEN